MAQEIFRVYGTVAVREDGDIEQRMNDIGESAENAGGGFNDLLDNITDFGAGALGVTSVLTAVGVALKESVEFSEEWSNALGDLKFDTNATGEEIKMFDQTMEDIYRKGYGESIGDVANAISEVHRQTGALNEELDNQTEKTMVLSEKMDADYGETIRTVDNLVKTFGITHDEAFDLIAKGYQENLNVGGDLLDLFNEYSVKLQQLGLDENDMLNILIEGQKKGIFNYDILLDGIKEYQIRVAELAQDQEGSKEFFKELGLDVKDVAVAYSEGGEAAREMSQKIWEALESIEDPLERNRIGTELFGTMWEDTGGKINTAALGIQNDINETKGTMDKLIETKTDTLTEEFDKAKRKMEVQFFKPVGKLLTDLAGDILSFYNKADESFRDGFEKLVKSTDKYTKKIYDAFENWMDRQKEYIKNWKKDTIRKFNDMADDTIEAIASIVDFINKIKKDFDNFTSGVAKGFDGIKDSIGGVINKISDLSFPSPPDWLPGFADGVRNLKENKLAVVGERGPELVYLPKGSSVYSNEESRQMLSDVQGYNNTMPLKSSGDKIIIEQLIIDPKNIGDMNDFVEMITNFKNNKLAYGGV